MKAKITQNPDPRMIPSASVRKWRVLVPGQQNRGSAAARRRLHGLPQWDLELVERLVAGQQILDHLAVGTVAVIYQLIAEVVLTPRRCHARETATVDLPMEGGQDHAAVQVPRSRRRPDERSVAMEMIAAMSPASFAQVVAIGPQHERNLVHLLLSLDSASRTSPFN